MDFFQLFLVPDLTFGRWKLTTCILIWFATDFITLLSVDMGGSLGCKLDAEEKENTTQTTID